MKIYSTFLIVFLFVVSLSHFSCESSKNTNFDEEQSTIHNSSQILFDTITNLSLNADNDLENDELFGQVKSLKKVDSSLNKLEPTYDDYNYIYFYKENGNYDSTILFYEDNSLFLRLNYFYLENRLTHIDFLDEYSKTTNFYIYDKQGNNYSIYSVVDTTVESITNYYLQ